MIPVLPPSAIAQELTACTVLGGCTGVVRAVFPVRGRAAWVPDFLWVGTVLTLLQSYAAGQSPAGVLRWYMAAAGFAGAGAAAFVLGVPLRMAGKALQRRVLRPAAQRRVRQQNARKLRRNAKRTAKKRKKKVVVKTLVRVFFVLLLLSMLAAYISNQVSISSKRAELDTLNEQIDQQKTENEEMQRILSGDSDQITEWVARDSYNYAAPNERIFVDVTGS